MKRPAALLFAGMLAVAGCSANDGAIGPAGPAGEKGDTGPAGTTGPTGAAGQDSAVAPVPAGAGLLITIQSVTFGADNKPSATILVTDAQGKPLDLLAELAANAFGARGPRYTIAQLQADGTYRSLYESSEHAASSYPASVSGETAEQTIARVSAMYTKVGDGVYAFRWPVAAAAAPVASATHTVGVWASRAVNGVSYPRSATFDYVPGGGTPTNREVVSDAACNACHKNLQAHGSRRTVKLCLTCHYPGYTEGGVGIDFRVMIHQIHGSSTGVAAASGMRGGYGVYVLGTHSFEHVAFAPRENEVRNCESCHRGAADNWKAKPGKVACGSCHRSDVATVHIAGFAEAACVLCHGVGAGRAIEAVHGDSWSYENDSASFTPRQTTVTIDSADFTTPTAAKVTFTVKVDGAPVDLKASDSPFKFQVTNGEDNPSLRLSVAGPVGLDASGNATDYGIQSLVPGAPAAVGYVQSANFTSDANTAGLVATGAPGQFTFTFTQNLTAALGTTVAIGAEGMLVQQVGNESHEYPITRTTLKFAKVGGGDPTPRRAIADDAKCNACHLNLGFHGGNGRKGVDYCSFCHHSSNVNNDRVAKFEMNPLDPTQHYTVQPESVWLPVMVHKIHSGGELANAYTLGGNPGPNATAPGGTPTLFAGSFPQPGGMLNCLTCHKPGTFGLPPKAARPMLVEVYSCLEDPAADTDDLCNGTNGDGQPNWRVTATRYVPAQQAVCTSCHDGDATAVHVQMTTAGQAESCEVCHGSGRDWDAATIHVPPQ